MCIFGGGESKDPPAPPIRYQQQKTPTRQDTVGAQDRAVTNRRKATRTLLAPSEEEDKTSKKTLLGGS